MRLKQTYTDNHTVTGGGCSAKTECAHALKGLALPRASHFGKITLAGSCRLSSKLAAAHAVVAVSRNGRLLNRHNNCARGLTRQYRQVPKFSPYGSVCCACAEVTENIKYFSMRPKLRHPAVHTRGVYPCAHVHVARTSCTGQYFT